MKNPHLERAIEQFRGVGKDFMECIAWHLAFGVVLSTKDVICCWFRSNASAPSLPAAKGNCAFVSYVTGNMGSAFAHAENVEYVAFKRGFKTDQPVKAYPRARIERLINLNHA